MIAAHLSHLILNWNEESFIFRQRINCDGRRNDRNEKPKPPHALPANIGRNIRKVRGVCILFVLIWELINYFTASGDAFDVDVSYVTHLCGAAAGFITGYIFLIERHTRKAARYSKYFLFVCFYGILVGYILREMVGRQQDTKCSWGVYERQCQDKCYLHCHMGRYNNSCNVNVACPQGIKQCF